MVVPLLVVDCAPNTANCVKRSMAIHVLKAIKTHELLAELNIGMLHEQWFLKWFLKSNIAPARLISKIKLTKTKARTIP